MQPTDLIESQLGLADIALFIAIGLALVIISNIKRKDKE